MNKDHFGYYLVNNYKTYSKIEALERAHLFNTPVQWIFNEDVFSKYPWHIDNKQDLKKLYKKRAEQIRNKYDYIVIWYSGGADSFTVLNTFKENNIHVDEIAQFHSYEGTKSWEGALNKEVKVVAIPQTQNFLKAMPHTKHRIIDMTTMINSVHKEDNNKFDFIYKGNHSFSPHQLVRSYFREKIADYRNIIASGKKLCFVWGADKPSVKYDVLNDKFFLHFKDMLDGAGISNRTQTLNREEEYDELFYWSPDAMDIIARQGHIIINYLRNPPKQDIDSVYLTKDPYTYVIANNGEYVPHILSNTSTKINNETYYLTTRGLHRLVYPDYDEDTFTVGKPFSTVFSPKDRWWFKAGNDEQNIFVDTVQSFYKKFTKWGFNNFNFKQNLINNSIESPTEQDTYKKLQIDLVNKLKSKSSYVQDFRDITIDLIWSKKYYLEKLNFDSNKIKSIIRSR